MKCPSPPSAGQMRRHFSAWKAAGAPGARFASPGWPKPQPERSQSKNSGWRARKAANLAFILLRGEGAGGKQQPPARRDEGGALSRIDAPSAAQCSTRAWLYWLTAAASLRNIPSPEQGASTSTQSNKPGSAAASRAVSSLVTTALVTPIRSRFWRSTAARPALYSFASSSPCPASAAASWLDLPPGAAHRSATPHAGPHAEQRGRGRGAGFLHIKSPGMVPWVAAGAQVCVRQPESGRRKRRWAQRQPALGQKALRGQPQRVGRDAAGRRFGRVAQQRFAAAAEQRAFPRKEGFRVFEHPITCWIYQKSEEWRV